VDTNLLQSQSQCNYHQTVIHNILSAQKLGNFIEDITI